MTWIIDDIPLSTLAFNISNRSAAWKVPGKRGDNLVIPGRNGSQWVPNKPFEPGQLSLSMWAIGSDEDGNLPAHGDLARQARDNLDKLTALFAQSHKLLNVVKVQGKAFGVRNIATNPSFEGSETSSLAYSNHIVNPSFRKMTSRALTQNLFLNPDFKSLVKPDPWIQTAKVLNPDPFNKFYRSSVAVNTGSNYFYPSNYENLNAGTDLPGWVTLANVTKTVQGNTTQDQAANPLGGFRVGRFLSTAALAASSLVAQKTLLYVNQGGKPQLRFRVRRHQATSTVRTIQIRLVGTDDAGTVSGGTATGAYKTITLPTNNTTWVDATYGNDDYGNFTMADPTTRLRLDIRTGEAWTSGDGILVDCFQLRGRVHPDPIFNNIPEPFWDSFSGWGGLTADATGVSPGASRWALFSDPRWTIESPTSTSSAWTAAVEVPGNTDPSGTQIGFIAQGVQTGGTQGFVQSLQGLIVGDPYGLMLNARGLAGTTSKIQLQSKATGETSWTTRLEISYTGTAAGTGTASRMDGNFDAVASPGVYRPDATDALRLRVEVPVQVSGHHILQLAYVGVSSAVAPISGDTASTQNETYSWTGVPFNSSSVLTQRKIRRLNSRASLVSTMRPVGATTDQFIAQSTAFESNDTASVVVLDAVAVPSSHQGFYASVQAMVSSEPVVAMAGVVNPAPTGRLTLEFLNSGSSVLQTLQTSSVTLDENLVTPNKFNPLSLVVPKDSVPAGATQVRMSVSMDAPYPRGTDLLVWRPILLPTAFSPSILGLPSYFSGASSSQAPFSFSWEGLADDSSSLVSAQVPAVWYVVEGQQIINPNVTPSPPTRISARSTAIIPGNAPKIVFAHPMDTTFAAGQYSIGCKCRASVESSPGVEVATSAPVTILVEFWNGSTKVSSHSVGTVSGKTGASNLTLRGQGTLTVPGAFTEIRVGFLSQRIDANSLVAEIDSGYLSRNDTDTANPLPRLDFDRIPNAGFERGLELWRTLDNGTAPTSVAGYEKTAYALGTGSLISGDVSISAGQNLHVQTLYRRLTNNLATSVRWCRRTKTNFALDPSFSTVSGKTATGGSTLALSTAWSLAGPTSVSVTPGTVDSGMYPFGAPDGTMKRLQLVPGQGYIYSVSLRLTQAQTGTLHAQARRAVVAVKQGGVWNTSFAVSAAAANAVAVTRLSVAFILPANAEDCYIWLCNGSSNAGNVAWFDRQMLEDVPTVGSTMETTLPATYFDGDLASTANVWYRWVDPLAPMTAGSESIAYSTSNGVVGSETAGGSGNGASAFNRVYQVLAAPSGTEFAVVVYFGEAVRLYWTYAGVDFATHEESGTYDGYPYWFFDGAQGEDFFGNPVLWAGEADNSQSRVMPKFASGWTYTTSPSGPNVHSVNPSSKVSEVPSGYLNHVGGLQRIPKGTSRIYRTVGYALGENFLLSGQVSVAVADGAVATLGIYGAASSTGSGTLLSSQTFSSKGLMVWSDLDVSPYQFVYLQVVYSETKTAPGYRVFLDNLLLMPLTSTLGNESPGYFDGSTSGGGWSGTPHGSVSQYYGGGRRCYAEVREAIDMSSMAGGTRAEFVVDMDVPGSLWEDLILSTVESTFPGSPTGIDALLDITQLAGTTAMIDDAVISVKSLNGTVSAFTLTDVATNSSITLTNPLTAGQEIVIDNGAFTVKQGSTSWISWVTRSGSNANLLALTPMSSVLPPRLRIQVTGANASVVLKVVARRRYAIA